MFYNQVGYLGEMTNKRHSKSTVINTYYSEILIPVPVIYPNIHHGIFEFCLGMLRIYANEKDNVLIN